MLVNEIFMSIQGESSCAGLPCVFVRLAGCNLSCNWCDTPYARVDEGATDMTVDEVMTEVGSFKCSMAEVTGGEPMLQSETPELLERLIEGGYKVLMETNGSVSLKGLPDGVVKIVDVKCPSSGQGGSFMPGNIEFITDEDEVKFVIGNREDYDFAKQFITEYIGDRTTKVLFAPVNTVLSPDLLADWILKDCLKVRLQLQIHTYIWDEKRGR